MGTVLIVTGTGFVVFINFVLYCCLRVASEADEKMERAYMFLRTDERKYMGKEIGLAASAAGCETEAAAADTGTAANAETAEDVKATGNAETAGDVNVTANAETAEDEKTATNAELTGNVGAIWNDRTSAAGEIAADDLGAAVQLLIERNISVSAMESCTSGLLASGITDTEGASAVFKGSFVTYSNEAKVMQGVPEETIAVYGVYSPPVAEAMAEACRTAYGAQIGIGVTGTTGNTDPNNSDSVPGEIYYAILWNEQKCSHTLHLETSGLTRQDLKRRIVAEIARTLRRMLTA